MHFEWFSIVGRALGVDEMEMKACFYVAECMRMRTMLKL